MLTCFKHVLYRHNESWGKSNGVRDSQGLSSGRVLLARFDCSLLGLGSRGLFLRFSHSVRSKLLVESSSRHYQCDLGKYSALRTLWVVVLKGCVVLWTGVLQGFLILPWLGS